MSNTQFAQYLQMLERPYKKLAKIEFLQPDNSVAFALSNDYKRGYNSDHDTRAFIAEGTLNVSLQNGQRRKASITLANTDNAFDYAYNKIWFGQKIRLSMGLELPDGTEYYLPQGVFYISNPEGVYRPGEKSVSFPLVDKWSYLDGELFGMLEASYQVNVGSDIFGAIASILRLSKYTYNTTTDITAMIDNVAPIFTPFYNGKTYLASNSDGSISSNVSMLTTPYTITETPGGTFAQLLLDLNTMLAGLIGYDATGALRLDPSQDDIDDSIKPILWNFSPEKPSFLGLSETIKNGEMYNDVLIAGEGLTNNYVWGRAQNTDPASDTNINICGLRTYYEARENYWNTAQCAALAEWYLKRKTILQKAVNIESTQMFHLSENQLITVKRTDKPGSPIEKHIIQSFSLPIGYGGNMTINAVSANDIPKFTVTTGRG